MVRKIERDYRRFRDIIKGNIRKDFKKYISNGEMIGREGKYIVSIPYKNLKVPTFRHKMSDDIGVGHGEGKEGDPVNGQQGSANAGDQPGKHVLEVELTLSEIAEIMEKELQLPRIKPKGKDEVLAPHFRYTTISKYGPETLRHFKRTYRHALKRQIVSGRYDKDNPKIVPERDDRRYKFRKLQNVPQNNAVIIYMMDISGSMADEQKDIVRTEIFWIDTWLRSQYKRLVVRYLVHDAVAWEVDREKFFRIRESGGTRISSVLELCTKIIQKDYPADQWNVYPFHFSDGDNWGQDDTQKCSEILKNEILPNVNMFCYGQVKSAYGSGQFKKDLDEAFKDDGRVITSEIKDKEHIYDSIKDFLGKGK
ncbi:MAG: DUF444 family protein [Planctomycetes bacterium]|nr:DUF444 family protein [Planctomycetota bacterium]